MNSNQKLENLQRRIKIQTEQVGTFGGDSDLNSTFHLTISQLKSMTKNQLAKQGVFYAAYRKDCYSSLSTSCYPARQPPPKSFL
jgi:hypothetical protein